MHEEYQQLYRAAQQQRTRIFWRTKSFLKKEGTQGLFSWPLRPSKKSPNHNSQQTYAAGFSRSVSSVTPAAIPIEQGVWSGLPKRHDAIWIWTHNIRTSTPAPTRYTPL